MSIAYSTNYFFCKRYDLKTHVKLVLYGSFDWLCLRALWLAVTSCLEWTEKQLEIKLHTAWSCMQMSFQLNDVWIIPPPQIVLNPYYLELIYSGIQKNNIFVLCLGQNDRWNEIILKVKFIFVKRNWKQLLESFSL